MSAAYPFFNLNESETLSSKIVGVVNAIVTNNQDPEGWGRVKLKFPWLSDDIESNWARIATPMAGKEMGVYFLPEVNDEVLVMFERGDMRFPYVLGGLWNGQDSPPATNDDGKNHVRLIKSRSGHIVRLTDEPGKEKIEILDKTGKNQIVIDTASNTLTISTDKDIILSAKKGKISLAAQTIELDADNEIGIKSKGTANLEAQATMGIKTNAAMNINGSVVNIN
jgi:uncharacterized protein involved in type VI secretion and phage assembly